MHFNDEYQLISKHTRKVFFKYLTRNAKDEVGNAHNLVNLVLIIHIPILLKVKAR